MATDPGKPKLSAKAKLTIRTVKDAKHPLPGGTKSSFHIWDTDLHGFALKVTPANGKVFLVDWRMPGGGGAPKGQFTIGKFGSPWTVETARDKAREILAMVREGRHPNQLRRDLAREAVDLAFDKVVERFIDRYAKEHQPRTWSDAKRTLDRDVVPKWKSTPLPQIARADASALLQDIAARGATQQARYTHAILRKLFRWAVQTGQLETSPMVGMAPPAKAAPPRERVLTDAELAEIWQATDKLGEPFGTITRLLIATGQRRDECGWMAWDELDLTAATWTIPGERAKNGKAHIVPLNVLAMATIKSLDEITWKGRDEKDRTGLIFSTNIRTAPADENKAKTGPSGWSKAKKRLDEIIKTNRAHLATEAGDDPEKVAAMTPWRLHDLRRTMATGLQKLGVRLEVTEAALNHISGSRAGIVGVYQRHDWADEKRAAMDAWGAHLSAVLAGKAPAGNVVQMDRKRRKRAGD